MSGKSNGTFSRQIAYTQAVTPSDSADLPGGVTRAIMVGVDGNLAVTYANGSSDIIFLLAGVVHPIQVARIKSTGTTATSIKAGY